MERNKAKSHLTNEYLMKQFSDNFSLALGAIATARIWVGNGRDFTLTTLLESVGKSSHSSPREDK